MNPEEFESKYFIDPKRYNCPFCNVRSVKYEITQMVTFSYDKEQMAYVYFVECENCHNVSYHLSKSRFYNTSFNSPPSKIVQIPHSGSVEITLGPNAERIEKEDYHNGKVALDDYFYYHYPYSPFSVYPEVPKIIKGLIEEAYGCKKQNFYIGASGALRKAIYEFLNEQKIPKLIEGEDGKKVSINYEDRIKLLKEKYPKAEEEVFDALAGIQSITSVALHEDEFGNWEPWKPKQFDYVLQVVQAAMYEVYAARKRSQNMLEKVNEMRQAATPKTK